MLNCFFSLSRCISANTFCLSYKNCIFAESAYVTEKAKLGNNGFHNNQDVTHSRTSRVLYSCMVDRVNLLRILHTFTCGG